MKIFLEIITIAILLSVLSLASRFLVSNFKKITSKVHGNNYKLSSLIIGLGTTIPEMVIGIEAALKGKPTLSLGNALGSNIANLSIVIGGATLLAGKVKILDSIIKQDIFYAFLIAAAPLLLLSDGSLTRLDGVILLLLYFTWQGMIFAGKKKRSETSTRDTIKKIKLLFAPSKYLFGFIISLLVLIGSAEFLVRTSISLATQLQIPGFLIGVFILGLGSSSPELAFMTRAIRNKEFAITMGDLLGAVVANASLILGITVLISPITLFHPREYFSTTIYFLGIFFLFYHFIKTKKTLEKWEAAFLVASYFLLVALEFG